MTNQTKNATEHRAPAMGRAKRTSIGAAVIAGTILAGVVPAMAQNIVNVIDGNGNVINTVGPAVENAGQPGFGNDAFVPVGNGGGAPEIVGFTPVGNNQPVVAENGDDGFVAVGGSDGQGNGGGFGQGDVVPVATGPAAVSAAFDYEHVALEFEGCSAEERKDIEQAVAMALQALAETGDRLSGLTIGTYEDDVVERWFGDETSRFEVAQNLKYIEDRLSAGADPIVAKCEPNNPLFAYTWCGMQGRGELTFGAAFFQAALVGGWDSQMGTVVHELAHMTPRLEACYTNHHGEEVYAISEMEMLARTNPDDALDNAQNYEYLVEQLFDNR